MFGGGGRGFRGGREGWVFFLPRWSKKPGVLTAVLPCQAEVLEVVDALGVHQLQRLKVVDGRPAIIVGQATLQRHVVVLHAPAHEISLDKNSQFNLLFALEPNGGCYIFYANVINYNQDRDFY